MKIIPPLAILAITLALSNTGLHAEPEAKTAAAIPVAATPTPKEEKWFKDWNARHLMLKKRAEAAPEKVKLVFLGDSITQSWEYGGKKEWNRHFAKFNALGLGCSGDQTEHVLWRLQQNEWPSALRPMVAVIMIGTNNTKMPYKPEETAAGIKAIVDDIRKRSPQTRIILHAIFPRGATAKDPARLINDKVNAIIAKLDDGDHVRFLDIGSRFLDANGDMKKGVMHDLIHPSATGYKIWAEALDPEIAKLMAKTAK